MDVVLLQDLETLGREGSIVQVKRGYARNYLLPRQLAALATPAVLKRLEETKKLRAVQRERAQAEAEALKQQVERQALALTLTAGENDTVFGSVTVHDLFEALKARGVAVEKSAIRLERPIKTLGEFDVPVRLHADVTATLKVSVTKG